MRRTDSLVPYDGQGDRPTVSLPGGICKEDTRKNTYSPECGGSWVRGAMGAGACMVGKFRRVAPVVGVA